MNHKLKAYDFIIVGAGAAGLYAALLLHQRGFNVKVFEKKAQPSSHSRSIGIHPPSLELLHEAGVLELFLAHGLTVTQGRAIVTRITKPKRTTAPYDRNNHQIIRDRSITLGSGTDYDRILVIQQNITEHILSEALPQDLVQYGSQVVGFKQDADGVEVEVLTESGSHQMYTCSYLLAADGMYSETRAMSGIRWTGKTYAWPFCMGDFPDNTPFGAQAVIYLTPEGLVESFPLPSGLRRWVINVAPDTRISDDNSKSGTWHHSGDPSAELQTRASRSLPLNLLTEAVYQRTGQRLNPADAKMFSSFRAHRYSAESSVNGRVILLGDAAHVISPIGGQGMNFGWMNIRALVGKIHPKNNDVYIPGKDLSSFDHLARANASKFGSRAHFNTIMGLPGKPALLMALATDLLLSAPLRPLFVRRFTMR